jgi:murein DD-endopeptidase MepM/ murein hydrolase activator NlpD
MKRLVRTSVVVIIFAASAGCSGGGDSPTMTGARPVGRVSALPLAMPSSPMRSAAAQPSLTPMASPTPTEVVRYVFPISPADAASYGRVHHDYPATDVFAPCGTDVVAVVGGVVQETSLTDVWSAATDDPAVRGGLSVSLVGDDGVRYYSSHVHDVLASIVPGTRVEAGQLMGHVGDTGNAAGRGCHVHFGISPACGPGDWSVRRGILSPWPYLDAWREGGQASPAADVRAWLNAHPDQCANR